MAVVYFRISTMNPTTLYYQLSAWRKAGHTWEDQARLAWNTRGWHIHEYPSPPSGPEFYAACRSRLSREDAVVAGGSATIWHMLIYPESPKVVAAKKAIKAAAAAAAAKQRH